jgi:glycine cleavage system H protein
MKTDASLSYSAQHLWVKKLSDMEYCAGVTDYAQDLLGDIVFIDFPKVGAQLSAGVSCGVIESVKTGSDLHAPMDGVVTEVNQELLNAPEQINDYPYQSWIFKFTSNHADQFAALLSADQYQQSVA